MVILNVFLVLLGQICENTLRRVVLVTRPAQTRSSASRILSGLGPASLPTGWPLLEVSSAPATLPPPSAQSAGYERSWPPEAGSWRPRAAS